MNPGSLPDLPPEVFGALQTIERALDKAHMTRTEHMEAQQALSGVARFCIEANAKLKAPADVLQPGDANGAQTSAPEPTASPLIAPVR